jgi:hypothetical protein
MEDVVRLCECVGNHVPTIFTIGGRH